MSTQSTRLHLEIHLEILMNFHLKYLKSFSLSDDLVKFWRSKCPVRASRSLDWIYSLNLLIGSTHRLIWILIRTSDDQKFWIGKHLGLKNMNLQFRFWSSDHQDLPIDCNFSQSDFSRTIFVPDRQSFVVQTSKRPNCGWIWNFEFKTCEVFDVRKESFERMTFVSTCLLNSVQPMLHA